MKKQTEIWVGGKTRTLTTDEDPRALSCLTLGQREHQRLKRAVSPIKFPVSADVPIGYPGESTRMAQISLAAARALMALYQDEKIRNAALPQHLSEIVGEKDFAMANVGFDFFVGPHLDGPKLIEVAAFGPQFVSSAKAAEFFGIRTLEERLSTWFETLVTPLAQKGDRLYYVTSVGDLNFTREGEHNVLIPYLQRMGIQADSGTAEGFDTTFNVVFLRVPTWAPPVWARLRETKLWKCIRKGKVRVIPPLGNNFFSSKYHLPFLADEEELIRRGVSPEDAQIVARAIPPVVHLNQPTLGLVRKFLERGCPIFLKGIWNYGGYGTRCLTHPSQIGKALQEIGAMPIVAQLEIPYGFLPCNFARGLPDRRVEVRVAVFHHPKDEKIKVSIPSARVYFPQSSFPEDSLFLSAEITGKH